jgi:glycosyltransferase involved in cell wall biosynthesis
MGAGDAFDEMVGLSRQLGIDDIVDFPGWVGDEFIQRCLSTADICVAPDPPTAYNDACTMNKIVEYMAMARPIVSFDLVESRVSAADSAVYVGGSDVEEFALAIDELLGDPERRKRMGSTGRERIERELSWDTSRRNLLELYSRVIGRTR